MWRASGSEINYIINNRPNHAYLQSVGTVNGVKGQIILPDAWILPDGVSFLGSAGNYDINTYSIEEWEIMENAGAVFLPCSGYRTSNEYRNYNSYEGSYWGRGGSENGNASTNNGSYTRFYGLSVRLIQNY